MRLIDADALKKCMGCEDAVKYGNKTAEQQHNSYSTMMMYEIADYIDDMPTIEAEPVRYGEGKNENSRATSYLRLCSACGKITYFCGIGCSYKYCPNCGAKMDGGKHDAAD